MSARQKKPLPMNSQVLFALWAFLTLLPGALSGQGWVEPGRGGPGSWVERVESRIQVEIRGNVATVVVDEWFLAHGRGLGEADYLYPLPTGAAFQGFSLYQGGQELRGEIMDAERAREIYQEIVRKRRDPALIELAGQGLLRARIFPLAPGEKRKVTLRYTQLLPRAGDALLFRYHAGASHAMACTGEEAVPVRRCPSGRPPMDLEVSVPEGSRFLEPFSPTHPLQVRRQAGALRVDARDLASGAFSLFLPMARAGLGISLATHKPLGEDGYFLLSLSPGKGDASPEPRDLSIVLDVSGSMSGEKIRQAKGALLDLLDTLSREDRFRIVAFSNAVRPFSLDWQPVRPDVLSEARDWVKALEAEGGTNMAGALAEALRLPASQERLPVTVFLTDGLPTVGETSVDAISNMVRDRRGRVRIFAFGVGHDVNTALLDRMSEEGRGSTSYVAPGESVERALSLLSTKIRYPVLTDLALTRSPVRLKEIYPVQIPDVFAGEELVLFGRYEESGGDNGSGEITIQGRRGGETREFSLEAHFPEQEEANEFLPRLWASRKLGYLTRRVWTEGESQELVEEIRALALRYGLPSPFTSYLVQEPEMVRAGPDQRGGLLPGLASASPATTPTFSTQGARAVGQARRAKALRDVSSVAELREAEEDAAGVGNSVGPDARLVAGRLFRLEDGVWMDAEAREDGETVTVEPFSPAYFDLLEMVPELKPFAQEFSELEVQGVALRIRIREGGDAQLSPEALAAVRTAFMVG